MGIPLVAPPLGPALMANSLPVVLATDDPLRADTASIKSAVNELAWKQILDEEAQPWQR